jgi:hypothetical protein
MEVEQVMACLQAEIRAGLEEIMATMRTTQEKMDTNLKEIVEDMRAWQK